MLMEINQDKQRLSAVLNDSLTRWMFVAAAAVNGSLWLAIWRWFPHTPGGEPLHYTIYFGINLTGSWSGLFILPGIGALAILSHLIISRIIRHATWQRMWSLLSLVINILAAIATAAVMYLVRVNGL